MKALLVADDNFLPVIGGAELAIYNIAKELSNRGFDVLVLCSGLKGDNELVRKKYDINFRIVRYTRFFRKLNTVFLLVFILYFYLVKKYRIVHAHCTCRPGFACALLKKIIPLNYILTPHGRDIQRMPEINYGIRLNKKMDKRVCTALNKASFITSISSSILGELACIPDMNLRKVFSIPNGFDIKNFSKAIKYDIKEIFKLPLDSIVLISVGRNHIKKNYSYAIKSLKYLKAICPPEIWKRLVYIIVGKDVKENQNLVDELGLKNKVILSDPIFNDMLADCYRTSDLFLNPSLIEGFALVNLEAMAAGLPIIATNVPGNRDAINDKVGYLVDVNFPQQMADKILSLLKDRNMKNLLSQNAAIESQNYTWQKVVDKYVDLYKLIETA